MSSLVLCPQPAHSNSICDVKTDTQSQFDQVFATLLQRGLLLESDPKLPSVSGLITGEPLRGSWWSHPQAQTIFQINERLADHEDVLITKLVSGKITFVHRRLWAELFAIGTARESWQTTGLSTGAKRLLKSVDQRGSVRTDQLIFSKSFKPGELARELEKRLLVQSEEFHTESGAHAKLLQTWQHWSNRAGFQPQEIALTSAKSDLEDTIRKLNEEYHALAVLPWQSVRRSRRSDEN